MEPLDVRQPTEPHSASDLALKATTDRHEKSAAQVGGGRGRWLVRVTCVLRVLWLVGYHVDGLPTRAVLLYCQPVISKPGAPFFNHPSDAPSRACFFSHPLLAI